MFPITFLQAKIIWWFLVLDEDLPMAIRIHTPEEECALGSIVINLLLCF